MEGVLVGGSTGAREYWRQHERKGYRRKGVNRVSPDAGPAREEGSGAGGREYGRGVQG